ncbi:MAG: O-antigen ligase family protein [Gaiellales bacterium]
MPPRIATSVTPAATRFERFGPGVLGVLLVAPAALDDGGFFRRSWLWLAMLFAAMAGLGLLRGRPKLSGPTLASGVALAGLGVLALVSRFWVVRGTDTLSEAKRTGLYLLAFVALVACVRATGRAALLGGVVVGIAIATGASLWNFVYDRSDPHDPYNGNLLSDPLGYPNAIGLLVAIGALLALGLDQEARDPRLRRCLGGLVPVFLLGLSLSGSRGALLAIAGGVALAVALSPARVALVARAVPLCIVGAVGALAAQSLDASLVPLVVAAIAVGGASMPFALPTAWLRVAGVGAIVAAVALLAVQRPSVSSSFRTDYWSAAVRAYEDHVVLGAGAGSFPMLWREYRQADLSVRDVHNLYLETLTELGPPGLVLVLVLVGAPLASAGLRRRAPLVAVSAGAFTAFALHAAVDWDWELPAVVQSALACGFAVAVVGSDDY